MPEGRKKPTRTRIDTILNAIKRGGYDEELNDIREAVEARYGELRAQVAERVLEVYGPEYEIVEKPSNNPFISKAHRTGQIADDPEAAARAAHIRAELDTAPPPEPQEDHVAAPRPGDPFGDGDAEDEPTPPMTTPPQAVDIVSAPERVSSPAFGEGSVSSPPPQVQMSDDGDDGYESRSPIITGGPPQ